MGFLWAENYVFGDAEELSFLNQCKTPCQSNLHVHSKESKKQQTRGRNRSLAWHLCLPADLLYPLQTDLWPGVSALPCHAQPLCSGSPAQSLALDANECNICWRSVTCMTASPCVAYFFCSSHTMREGFRKSSAVLQGTGSWGLLLDLSLAHNPCGPTHPCPFFVLETLWPQNVLMSNYQKWHFSSCLQDVLIQDMMGVQICFFFHHAPG